MNLYIFDVEHGACALLIGDDGNSMMIDCGHNGSTGWRPGDALKNAGINTIGLLAITNYDEDHVSGLPNLREKVYVQQLWRNKSVSPETLKYLKSENGMGLGIDELVKMSSIYSHEAESPLQIAGVERRAFHLSYPEWEDENNLSFAVFLNIYGVGILFPGDLETEGWEALLKQNSGFRDAVERTNILIASHHGRENGIYDGLFNLYGCNPNLVVISDKGYSYDTQLTVPYYESKCSGVNFRGRFRKVLTTRNDGYLTFKFNTTGWSVE